MPATIDPKGVASGWSYEEDDWGTLMNQNLRILSALVADGFGQNILTTSGLTYGYRGGVGLTDSGLVDIAAGTLTLPASTTSYIIRNVAGVVSSTTNPVFASSIHLATVVTNATNIVSVVDERYFQDMSQDGTHTARVLAATANVSAATTVAAGTSITAGTDVTAGSSLIGNNLNIARPTAGSDILQALATLAAGSGAGGGENLYLQLALIPSNTAANRIARIQVGDNSTVRPLQLRVSRTYIGSAETAAFVGSEMARVAGSLQVDAGVTATQFNGSAVGLTAIPADQLTGSIADARLSAPVQGAAAAATAAQVAAAAAQSTADGAVAVNVTQNARLSAVEAARAFASVISDNVPVARVNFGAALGYTGANTGARGFNSILTVLPAAGVAYNQAAQQDIIDELAQIRDCLRQLAFDLSARTVL